MSSPFLDPGFAATEGFVDRTRELARLLRFLTLDCRVCVIHGIGGVGKSALAHRLTSLEGVPQRPMIWCSLVNAPILDDVIRYILAQSPRYQPRPTLPLIDQLVDCLSVQPCYVVLDNLEVLLDSERFTNSFRPTYEDYGPFLQRLGAASHLSTVIVTSRELPTFLRKDPPGVQSVHLQGLSKSSGRSLLARRRLRGDVQSRTELVDKYGGNPLAIQLAADLINDVHQGNIAAFLGSGDVLFREVNDLFDEHFERLTASEQLVLFRLAAARRPLTLREIPAGASFRMQRQSIPSILQQLVRRSLVQEREGRFFLQYLIQEFTSARLNEVVADEILSCDPDVLGRFPLIDAACPEYVRSSQRRFLTNPIVTLLGERLGSIAHAMPRLKAVIDQSRLGRPQFGTFAASNAMSIWTTLTRDLSGADLSGLVLRHVDMSEVRLSGASMRATELVDCRFPGVYHYLFALAFSPEANIAAIGQIGGSVFIVDAPSGTQRMVLPWSAEWVRAVVFSPDGAHLACSDERGRVRVWDLATSLPHDLGSHERQTRSLVFSADGRYLFSGGEDRRLFKWAVPYTGSGPDLICTCDGEIWGLHASPTGSLLAIAQDSGCLRVLDTETGEDLGFEAVPAVSGRSVHFSTTGQQVFVGCDDGLIRVWSTETRRLVATLTGHSSSVWSISVSGTRLITGSHDETIRIWGNISDPARARCDRILGNLDGPVWPVAASPDGKLFATVSRSSVIRFWDLQAGECLEALSGSSGAVLAIASNPAGTMLAGGGHDRLVRIWDARQGECLAELSGHWAGIRTLAFDPTGTLLASAGEDWDVRLWNLATMQQYALLQGARNWIWSVAFDEEGSLVAAGGADPVIRVWPVGGKGEAITLTGHSGRVRSVVFLRGRAALMSCGEDGQLRLWDLITRTNEIVGQVDAHLTCLLLVDGHTVLTGSSDGKIRMWDLAQGRCVQDTSAHQGGVLALLRGPDHRKVVSGGHDGLVCHWNLPNLTPGPQIGEAQGVVRSLAWCSDDHEIAAAGSDEAIRVRHLDTGAERAFRVSRQFEGLDISECGGLTAAQKLVLSSLGAVETPKSLAVLPPQVPLRAEMLPDNGKLNRRPIEVFVSYSHRDDGLRAQLDKHLSLLRYQSMISSWYDRMIQPGEEWRGSIDEHLERASIILLLVSSDFIASPYCRDVEMRRAMERHREGTARVIPVILRDCDWEGFAFGQLQALPRDGRAVMSWPDIDAAFTDIAVWIRKAIEDLASSAKDET